MNCLKNLRKIFYTYPVRVLLFVMLFILTFITAEYQVKYFNHFNQDNHSFINSMRQGDSFNYETSYYFTNTVVNTVDSLVTLCMEYDKIFTEPSPKEQLLEYYRSIGDKKFQEIYKLLSTMRGFTFALVNHDRGIIYSNISEINGKDNSENVRKHFGEQGKNLLIARSCKSPTFETDTFINYGEFIRKCANDYGENFDLYVRFGDENSFNENAARCKEEHFAMRRTIEKLNDTVIFYFALTVLVSAIILSVTGKHEPDGKTYLTNINHIPNDLLFVIYGLVLISIASLYRTSAYMLINHGTELDEFWFTKSEDFYINRIKFCYMIFVFILVNLMCILKRSYKTNTLFTNTYIYPFLLNMKVLLKKRKSD